MPHHHAVATGRVFGLQCIKYSYPSHSDSTRLGSGVSPSSRTRDMRFCRPRTSDPEYLCTRLVIGSVGEHPTSFAHNYRCNRHMDLVFATKQLCYLPGRWDRISPPNSLHSDISTVVPGVLCMFLVKTRVWVPLALPLPFLTSPSLYLMSV